MAKITVDGQGVADNGVTIILAPHLVTPVTTREAEEFIRSITCYQPYKWPAPGGPVVVGTSEVPRPPAVREMAEPPGRYLVRARTVQSAWVCGVAHSGYSNGATCQPADPHSGWNCGWKFHLLMDAPGPGEEINIPGVG